MAQLKLVNLQKKYDNGIVAIDSFNLEIEGGEFMVLVGPSGSGKSTILRMIAGLEEISQGEIYMDNVPVSNLRAKDREVAMFFQNYTLYPHMSVYENMAFPLKIERIHPNIIKEKIIEIAKKLEIEQLLDRKPNELSGGQKQRVAIGKVLAKSSKIILFDEPLSNLDASLRASMRMMINNLHKELKKTIVYVTHDQVEAMTMGDRICVLKDGKIMQVDTPLNLYNSPENSFVAGFLGTPSMNFVEGKIVKRENKFYLENGDIFLELPLKLHSSLEKYSEKGTIMGIRAEDICFSNERENNALEGTIEMIEVLGSEWILYVKITEEILLKMKVFNGQNSNLKVGEVIYCRFNMEKIHFFSKESGLKYKSEG